ncbi:hypothetical protein [Mycobacterium simiae]|uniref:hypothetical protein n=1 Tax=Mycobacterium simiae TaxID=1784 RepID=UPI0012DC4EA0|nr:hypothetical protein [Mycobacterium simiae]
MNAADWLTVFLSPATFAFVLIAELRFRRRFAPVAWWLHYDHAENDPDTDEPRHHHYQLINLGSESATNVSVEATYGIQTSGARMTVVKSGDSFPALRIEAQDFDKDWLLITWMDAVDRRYALCQWFPMNQTGPLEDVHTSQWRAATTRKWWNRLHRKTKAVGPGGVYLTSVRTGAKFGQNMKVARRLLEARQDQWIQQRRQHGEG